VLQDPSNPRPNPPTSRKWLVWSAKLLIAAAVLWWVRGSILVAWNQLSAHDQGQWQWRPLWLLAAGAVYLLGLLPFGLFWRHVLRVLGQDATLGETLRAYYIGHLGKYVPGKAMVVVLRAGLIRSHRVNTALAAVSVFFETLTMMAVGAFLAGAYTAFYFHEEPFWSAAAAVLMIVALLPTLPPIFKRLARLARVGKTDSETAANLDRLGYGTLLLGWGISVVGWSILGLSYWMTLAAMGIEALPLSSHWVCCVACVSLAVVAGFLLLILPGGVGVREAFLVELILPHLKAAAVPGAEAAAWASAFLLRLVWLAAELLISAALYPMGRRLRPKK
jgi:uncharacterized membrane protein YbhN (UPF0104 family)